MENENDTNGRRERIANDGLLASIKEKQERIKALRAEIKDLRQEMARVKSEEVELRKKNKVESEQAEVDALGLSGEWAKLPETGMSAREIISLYYVVSGGTMRSLGEKIGVTPGRARQIRDKALRKLRHPKRIGLVKNFDRELYRAVYGEYPANDQVEARRDGAPLPEKTLTPLPRTSC